jgi:hypothetical protein
VHLSAAQFLDLAGVLFLPGELTLSIPNNKLGANREDDDLSLSAGWQIVWENPRLSGELIVALVV